MQLFAGIRLSAFLPLGSSRRVEQKGFLMWKPKLVCQWGPQMVEPEYGLGMYLSFYKHTGPCLKKEINGLAFQGSFRSVLKIRQFKEYKEVEELSVVSLLLRDYCCQYCVLRIHCLWIILWVRKFSRGFSVFNLAFIISFFFLPLSPSVVMWHTYLVMPAMNRPGVGMINSYHFDCHTRSRGWYLWDGMSLMSSHSSVSQSAVAFALLRVICLPLAPFQGSMWRWGGRLSKETLPDFHMRRRFCGTVSVMGNFMLPQEAGRCVSVASVPTGCMWVAALVSICLVKFHFAIKIEVRMGKHTMLSELTEQVSIFLILTLGLSNILF